MKTSPQPNHRQSLPHHSLRGRRRLPHRLRATRRRFPEEARRHFFPWAVLPVWRFPPQHLHKNHYPPRTAFGRPPGPLRLIPLPLRALTALSEASILLRIPNSSPLSPPAFKQSMLGVKQRTLLPKQSIPRSQQCDVASKQCELAIKQ